MYFFGVLFHFGEWGARRFLQKLEGFRALRQGDALSPFFFITVMELFIEKVVQDGFFKGWEVEGRGGRGIVSHLLFDNNTLFV